MELALSPDPAIKLNKAKRERLLTLPRMQKENPPTHLIRSRSGDYLRGRLIKLDGTKLLVEIRLEPKEIPRDRLSLIVWLHPDELDPARKTAAPSPADAATRVQAVCNDGIRLTFLADRFASETLSGKSDVLGPCQVVLKEVGQLLIGGVIDKAAKGLAYQQWKLQNATEPKAFQADSGSSSGGRPLGTESALVGKPAPDFEVELLGGPKFHLAQTRGKVVVLDFWATWCGPCLQAMPQVERVASEFRDRDVQLIAVNLQEAPSKSPPCSSGTSCTPRSHSTVMGPLPRSTRPMPFRRPSSSTEPAWSPVSSWVAGLIWATSSGTPLMRCSRSLARSLRENEAASPRRAAENSMSDGNPAG